MGLCITSWRKADGAAFLPSVAELFQARTGIAAAYSPPLAQAAPQERGVLYVPRLTEGLSACLDLRDPTRLIWTWDGFPPNPYLELHLELAGEQAGGERTQPFNAQAKRFRPYHVAWRELPWLRRAVLSSQLLRMFW